MDTVEQTRKDQDRAMRARERLRFRVYSAVRDVVLDSQLFRSRPQLHEPDIFVNVYPELVDVNASLNETQLHLVPGEARPKELTRFAEQLREGIERCAGPLQLELTTDAARFGGSQPVLLAGLPVGYRAVLLRREPE